MKRLTGIILFVGFLVAMAPLHLSNAYLRSVDFETITVGQNESVWSIAARYTTDAQQADSLREAIVEVNGLDGEAAIRYGQTLRVPVLARQSPGAQLAEK